MQSYMIIWLIASSFLAAAACGTKDKKRDQGVPAADNPQVVDCSQSQDPQCAELEAIVDGERKQHQDGQGEDYWTDKPGQNDDAGQSDNPHHTDKGDHDAGQSDGKDDPSQKEDKHPKKDDHKSKHDHPHQSHPDKDHPGQSDDKADDPSQGPGDHDDHPHHRPPSNASAELRVRDVDSWLNFDINGEGELMNDQGRCLQSIQLGSDNSAVLTLNDLDLMPSYVGLSEFTRCRAMVRLGYRAGWRFAVSKISFVVSGQIKPESQAWLETLVSTKPFEDSSDQRKRFLFNRRDINQQSIKIDIPEDERSWSDCDQEDRLRLELGLFMNFKTLPETSQEWEKALEDKAEGRIDHGNLRILGEQNLSRVRLEFDWKRCNR